MTLPYARRLWLEDLLLGVALGVVAWLRPGGSLSLPLAVAILSALAWGYATLHVPAEVAVTAEGVSFSRYGRTHGFAWRDVARVRVRRLLAGDRVLVRLSPSPPWRGRYWLAEGAHAAALRELGRRASRDLPARAWQRS